MKTRSVAEAPSPALARFAWPTPPHFRVVEESVVDGLEHGIVMMIDGRKLVGHVVRMDPWALMLEFRLEQESANIRMGFSEIRSLCLSRLIQLERVVLNMPSENLEVSPTWSVHECIVHFRDGSDFVSEAIGVVARKFGLYLFVAKGTNQVQRWFIPVDAMLSHQLREPMGKLLVDHKIVSQKVIDAGLENQQHLRHEKLGEYLHKQHIVTSEQLQAAIRHQEFVPHLRLGDALAQAHVITEKQRDDALERQKTGRSKPLGTILVEMGAVSREDIRRVLVEQLGIPSVHLGGFQFDLNAIKTVPADLAHMYTAMPLCRTLTRIAIALEDPLEGEALHALEFSSGLRVDPVVASHDDLLLMIEQYYGPRKGSGNLRDLFAELGGTEPAAEIIAGEVITESDNTLVRLVNKIIGDAIAQGASDIHLESMPGNKSSRVRFRKDGILTPYTEIPSNFRAAVISRIKIMSDLDISERRRPQEGKISFRQYGPTPVELRVVTMPTAHGLEGVVMRILTAPKAISIEQIDLAPQVLADLKALILKPHGLLFACGPTGSGKTTTLHALLSHINTPDRKIWTVENPIEITQDGLNQVQVNAKIGLTFPEVLRSFLRADPDVIMVGETRDTETAATVITASLTGHLVLSTMHTNSAVESVVRLLDFGLDPFNFADALLGIIGQRLVRRLCPACRIRRLASKEEIDNLARAYCFETELDAAMVTDRWRSQYGSPQGAINLFAAAGCASCDQTGYKGRLGIHELLITSAAIKAKIKNSANVAEIMRTAMSEGLLTLKQDGIEKIFQGYTDLAQVQAVCL